MSQIGPPRAKNPPKSAQMDQLRCPSQQAPTLSLGPISYAYRIHIADAKTHSFLLQVLVFQWFLFVFCQYFSRTSARLGSWANPMQPSSRLLRDVGILKFPTRAQYRAAMVGECLRCRFGTSFGPDTAALAELLVWLLAIDAEWGHIC